MLKTSVWTKRFLQCHGFRHWAAGRPNHSLLLSHRSRSHWPANCGLESWAVGKSLGATGMSHVRWLQLHTAKLSVSGVPQKSERCCGESCFCLFICIIMSVTFEIDALWHRRRGIWCGPQGKSVGRAGILPKLLGVPCRAHRVRAERWKLCFGRCRVERQTGYVEWVSVVTISSLA